MHADTPENIARARTWTPIDEDLAGVTAQIRQRAIEVRKSFVLDVDIVRCERWHTPETVDVIADIPYLPDGENNPFHRLDLYLPHDAYLRGGKALPVYIDIHGGGFVYGLKELNKNFGVHLAAQGCAVFSLSYRLSPAADFLDQLHDVLAGCAWIARHLDDYPVDPQSVIITGDSAGATLGMYAVAALCNPEVFAALDVPVATLGAPGSAPVPSTLGEDRLSVAGMAFVSGLFDLSDLVPFVSDRCGFGNDDAALPTLAYLTEMGGFIDRAVDVLGEDLLCAAKLVERCEFPPAYLVTSSDDFIEFETLLFAGYLSRKGIPVECHSYRPPRGATLGHVFPVGQVWLEESREVLEDLQRFALECR
ncbi:alpha/beta hydrolase [Actinotignum sanguinis]|uniref:alpha/beta hydrolase n=1 Tax=Actinotignum sanguinis TaxID=1445614 RepID=UPI002550DCA2|nr:alpha/beta hydrolase [Actinotignum sanguinis]MDK8353236.1 alpha/beta hydrolase [Actinotignum sanguinis]